MNWEVYVCTSCRQDVSVSFSIWAPRMHTSPILLLGNWLCLKFYSAFDLHLIIELQAQSNMNIQLLLITTTSQIWFYFFLFLSWEPVFLALKREQWLCDQRCGLVHMGKPLFSVTWLSVCRNNREKVWHAVKADLDSYALCVCLQGSFYVPSENCLQRAYTWHRRICKLLLAAHRALCSYYTALMKEIPQLQHIEMGRITNSYVTHSLQTCVDFSKMVPSHDHLLTLTVFQNS